MAKKPSSGNTSTDAPPQSFAEIPPSGYAQSVGIGHVVESMMQMQQAIGELKATASHLKTASDSQSRKLDSISHRIYAAGAVLAVLLAMGGFFMNKIWDGVASIMQTQNAPRLQAPAHQQQPPAAGQQRP